MSGPGSRRAWLALLLLAALAALAGATSAGAAAGAVYVMTNDAAANEIAVFERDEQGLLTFDRRVSTGGRGSGGAIDPLSSQGALILSGDRGWLFAVNAGSNELSAFEVVDDGLRLTATVPSRGTRPVSLTYRDGLLYVVHAGGTRHIRGFRVLADGRLRALGRSRRALASLVSANGRASHPVQVEFSPDGSWLVVGDLDTDELHVFGVGENGRPSAESVISPSSGGGPFGFTFGRGFLVVTELLAGDSTDVGGAGALSSYRIGPGGALEPLSRSVRNFQTATCWVVSDGRRYVYATNTSSSTVSGYRVRRNGRLQRLAGDGVSFRFGGSPAALPTDVAATADGRFVYTLNAGRGTIGMFSRHRRTGRLTFLGEVGGLPAVSGLQGIAAR